MICANHDQIITMNENWDTIKDKVDYYVEQLINHRILSLTYEGCYLDIYLMTRKYTELEIRQSYHDWTIKLKASGASPETLEAFNSIFRYPINKYHLELAHY